METNNKDLINYTIIIPHYNIPKLLRRCLCSIPKRDDTQVIVVDDKSTDDNIVLLGALEKEFPHVEFLYSNINGGGGKARNIGLKKAKGKFVLFADADDCFNYCVNEILDEYIGNKNDIIFFNANCIDADTYLQNNRLTTLVAVMIRYKKNKNLSLFRYIFGEPWCKLIRREIIEKNNITFEELPVHNDTRFSYMVGYYAKDVQFDNRALYCLIDRNGSVSKQVSLEKQLLRVRVFSEKNAFLRDNHVQLFDYLLLNPFQYYMKRFDIKHLSCCFDIAKKYGFSKSFIIWKMIVRHCRTLLLGEIN